MVGLPYHQVLEQSVFTPAGLINTYLLDYGVSGQDPRMAHGYFRTFDGADYHGSHAWSSGGLVSNLRDLSTFMRALVAGEIFLQPSTFDLMVSPPDGDHYGLGMFVSQFPGGLSWGHGGGVFGYNSRMEYFPDLDALVISSMTSHGYDFMITNWYDDFLFPIIEEVRRVVD